MTYSGIGLYILLSFILWISLVNQINQVEDEGKIMKKFLKNYFTQITILFLYSAIILYLVINTNKPYFVFKDFTYLLLAIVGLYQWKRPMQSKTNFDLAINLNVNVLKIRDAIRDARAFLTYQPEIDRAKEIFEDENPGMEITYGIKERLIPSLRYRKLIKKYQMVYEDRITAEVLWEGLLNDDFYKLDGLIKQYNLAINLIGEKLPSDNEQFLKKIQESRRVIYGQNDDFDHNLKSIVDSILNKTRRYIKY